MHTSTINKILRNEKYIGDALLQKTYTTDFLNKTRVKNNGLVPQYYVEGNHEAIIPKDIYLQVQEELVRRRVVKTSANGKKRSYSCNHCFSQIVICGERGEMFRRLHWNIVELNLSSGAASAGWNLPDWNATPEPLTSWSFRMLSSRQSTRCLETKVAIRHSYSSTLPQSSELRRQLPLRTSTRS